MPQRRSVTTLIAIQVLEMSAIFLSAAVAPIFSASHPFIFNFGVHHGASFAALTSLLLQVFAELIVDGVALRVEARQGLPLTDYFSKLNRPVMLLHHMLSVVVGVMFGGLYRSLALFVAAAAVACL